MWKNKPFKSAGKNVKIQPEKNKLLSGSLKLELGAIRMSVPTSLEETPFEMVLVREPRPTVGIVFRWT